MATVVELEKQGRLFKFDAALGPRAQEFRVLYASQRLMRWMLDVLPMTSSNWNIELSPTEQLDAFLAIYASGETLTYGWQFAPISPIGDGVWELKTADVRVFGWFAHRDCFVGVVGDIAQRVKQHDLYRGYKGEVVRFRHDLNLNEPKFVAGDDPNAVVSNFDLP